MLGTTAFSDMLVSEFHTSCFIDDLKYSSKPVPQVPQPQAIGLCRGMHVVRNRRMSDSHKVPKT